MNKKKLNERAQEFCAENHIDEYPVKSESIIGIVTDYTKNGVFKSMDCFSQKLYSRLWVNTVLFRKIKRKAFVYGHNLKKRFKKD
jgi:hypothetical protein